MPQHIPGSDWHCALQITGLNANWRRPRYVFGIDALQALHLLLNEISRDFEINLKIDCRLDLGLGLTGPQLLNRSFKQLTVQIESNRFDVTVLLPSEQVAGTAQLEIECRDSEACSQLAELADGRQTAPCNRSQRFIRRNQQVCVSTPVRTADAPA